MEKALTDWKINPQGKLYRQADTGEVGRLVPIRNFSLANHFVEHSQPTIYNGVMYIVRNMPPWGMC